MPGPAPGRRPRLGTGTSRRLPPQSLPGGCGGLRDGSPRGAGPHPRCTRLGKRLQVRAGAPASTARSCSHCPGRPRPGPPAPRRPERPGRRREASRVPGPSRCPGCGPGGDGDRLGLPGGPSLQPAFTGGSRVPCGSPRAPARPRQAPGQQRLRGELGALPAL